MTARAYCFTYFPDIKGPISNEGFGKLIDDNKIDFPFPNSDQVRYLIYQWERCPRTKKIHAQGYVELKSPAKMAGIKTKLGIPNAHCERRMGTKEQAIAYCCDREKSGVMLEIPVVESGDRIAKQGERNDLKELYEDMEKKCAPKDLLKKYPAAHFRYSKGIQFVKSILDDDQKTIRDVKVHVYWGVSGAGKTHKVYAENEDVYSLVDPEGKWWDGYDGQETLLIDEFNGQMPIELLLKVLDKYPLKVPVKGGFRQAKWKKVVICSNHEPGKWYTLSARVKEALIRRVSVIEKFDKPWVTVTEVGRVIVGPTHIDENWLEDYL